MLMRSSSGSTVTPPTVTGAVCGGVAIGARVATGAAAATCKHRAAAVRVQKQPVQRLDTWPGAAGVPVGCVGTPPASASSNTRSLGPRRRRRRRQRRQRPEEVPPAVPARSPCPCLQKGRVVQPDVPQSPSQRQQRQAEVPRQRVPLHQLVSGCALRVPWHA
jgi:hypothetical protein